MAEPYNANGTILLWTELIKLASCLGSVSRLGVLVGMPTSTSKRTLWTQGGGMFL